MNSEKRTKGRSRGRGRGRPRGRGRGRGKKVAKVMSSDEDDCMEDTAPDSDDLQQDDSKEDSDQNEAAKLEVPSDISQLEAPVFTTLQRGPPEPMLRLDWGHRARLIGEKVLNPMIYCCNICSNPILIYGRMIPCKHVFCLSCARADHTHCPRCRDKVLRVEQTGLGSVYMCTHAGSRYGNEGCRRTYLSQRDLQAHINHRHVSSGSADAKAEAEPPQANVALVKPITVKPIIAPSANDPRGHGASGAPPGQPGQAAGGGAGEARRTARTNLITVPLTMDHAPRPQHADPLSVPYYNYYQPPAPVPPPSMPVSSALPVLGHNMSVPPPPYYATGGAYATAPPAPPPAYVAAMPQPVGQMAGGAGIAPPVTGVADAGRWPEHYAQPSVQVQPWPPHQHHYYR